METESPTLQPANSRKRELLRHFETNGDELNRPGRFNSAYRQGDLKFMGFLIPPGKRVLELRLRARRYACHAEAGARRGRGFQPDNNCQRQSGTSWFDFRSRRRGSAGNSGRDRRAFRLCGHCRHHRYVRGYRWYAQVRAAGYARHRRCIVIAYHSHLWEPVLKLGELLKIKSRQSEINYIATVDFRNLMDLADFEVISQEQRQLIPLRWFGLGPFINRFIAPLPGIRQLCLRTYLVGRPVRLFPDRKLSASILIPCRNEKGNIENAIRRMPRFGSAQEILFVEGNSSDGTFEECERVRDAYRDSWDIKVLKQDGKGKGDAVRKGFAAATGRCAVHPRRGPDGTPGGPTEILRGGRRGLRVSSYNGSRMIYPMEKAAPCAS